MMKLVCDVIILTESCEEWRTEVPTMLNEVMASEAQYSEKENVSDVGDDSIR